MKHRRPSSSTSEVSRHIHTTEPGHSIGIANAEILEVEPRWFERGVKEAMPFTQQGWRPPQLVPQLDQPPQEQREGGRSETLEFPAYFRG